jgi:hypothetical protein
MENQSLTNLGMFVALVLVLVNAIITKDIVMWVPSLGKRIVLILGVWLLPLIGAVIAYFSAELTWFRKSSNTSDGPGSIAGGLLGLDSFFNPGSRHTLETVQKEHVEERESGQQRNEIEHIQDSSKTEPDVKTD